MSFSFDFVKSQSESALERFAVENGNRSGGRGSGRPRRMRLKTTFSGDGSTAFETGTVQTLSEGRRQTPGRPGMASSLNTRAAASGDKRRQANKKAA